MTSDPTSAAERKTNDIYDLAAWASYCEDPRKDDRDFMAYMQAELAEFPCCHEEGQHHTTPPMFWPELIQCIRARAYRDGQAAGPRWLSIETAPKDGTRIMLWIPSDERIVLGKWQDDSYANKPRPHWSNELDYLFGRKHTRENQPTHWMPLSPAPGATP